MDSVQITAFLLISKHLVDVVPAAQTALPFGSWRTVFRERVLKATPIEVAQRVEHQVLNCRAVHVLQLRIFHSNCTMSAARWKPEGHGFDSRRCTKLAENQPRARKRPPQKLAGNDCLA